MDMNDDGDSSSHPTVLDPCHGRPPNNNTNTAAVTFTRHNIALANTFFPHGPTLFGTTWDSRIDHIAQSVAAIPRVRRAFVVRETPSN